MNILIATPLYPPQTGGPAKYAKSLAEELGRQGHKTFVVSYGAGERLLPPGVRHIWYFLRLLPRVMRADAVLALDTWSVGLPALYASKLFKRKLVVRIGGDALWEAYVERTKKPVKLGVFYDDYRPLSHKEKIMERGVRRLARYATFAFTTKWQQELWVKAYALAPERMARVCNFYPAPSTPHEALGKVFVAAGRDTVLKNKTGLHEAFARIKQAHPQTELDERILPPNEHAKRLEGCYAVVVASLSEVNPNTAIDAAAARKPFIAPQDCGGKEALADMGLFVDTADTAALEQALAQLLEPSFYQSCVAASAKIKPHGWSDIAREYLALLA